MSTNLTVIGNLAADPELRFTAAGKAVASFTVMTSTSKKNEAGEWESTDVTGWVVSVWDRLAENVAESLQKGDSVIVVGKAAWRSWENKDGSKGGRMEITAWNVGTDLKRAPVAIARTDRSKPAAPAEDAWASPAKQTEDFPF
jgi:single-strand DNA-binding protein